MQFTQTQYILIIMTDKEINNIIIVTKMSVFIDACSVELSFFRDCSANISTDNARQFSK